MKKLIYVLTIFAIFSCTAEYDNVQKKVNENYKQISDFYYLGDIHNEYMLNLALNFEPDEIIEADQALSYLDNFHLSFQPNDLTLDEEIKENINSPNIDPEIVYVNSELKSFLSTPVVNNKLDIMLTLEVIDKWEYSMFQDFITYAQNHSSFEDLDSFLDMKISEWSTKRYIKNTPQGNISGAFLAISKRSTEWWLDNPRYMYNPDQRVPIWFFADAVGAVAGGLVADHFGASDEGVMGAMVAGAITGSTGIVGKAGRWLHGLLIP